MKEFLVNLGGWFNRLFETVVSLAYIVCFTRIRACRDVKKMRLNTSEDKECIVLGNGPSLSKDLKEGKITEGVDIYAVNMFVSSDYFWKLKPKFYCIIDPAYFRTTDNERINNLKKELISSFQKVDWELSLMIPPYVNKTEFKKLVNNPLISICHVNISRVEGFKWFRHFAYRHYLGMPRAQTVLNMAIMSAINSGYKTVYLFGADHSWTRDLMVNDDNVVCYGDRHVYKPVLEYIKLDYDISTLLIYYSNMFRSHKLINEYANSVNCQVINCTEGSFVDAYRRKVMNNKELHE